MIGTQRSLADPAALAALVAGRYGLDVTGCVLLRSLVNDVYRVDTADGPRVLKVYRAGQHAAADVAWELDFGAAAARFHAAADDSGAGARTFTVEAALGRPYSELLPRLAPDVRTAVGTLIDDAVAYLDGLDLPRGVCHGDLSLDNLHLDGDRVIFYDLDRAGWGWRAADLTGPASTERWPAFLAGYRSVRPLSDAEVGSLPWLDAVGRIGDLHFHLVGKPLLRGTESIGDGWAEHNLQRLRAAAERL